MLREITERLDLPLEPDFDLEGLKDPAFYLDVLRLVLDKSLFAEVERDRQYRKADPGGKIQRLIDILCAEVLGVELPQVRGAEIAAGSPEDTFHLLQLILALLSVEEPPGEEAENESFERMERELLRTSAGPPPSASQRSGSAAGRLLKTESHREISVQATHQPSAPAAPGKRGGRQAQPPSELSLSEIGAAGPRPPSRAATRSRVATPSQRSSLQSQRSLAASRTSHAYLRRTEGALSSLLQRQRLELNAVLRSRPAAGPPPGADPQLARMTLLANRRTLQQLEEIDRTEQIRMRDAAATQLRAL